MRIIVLSGLLLSVFSVNFVLVADEPKLTSPTEKQMEAATKEYAKFGAELKNGQLGSYFSFPKKTTDADLKGLPDLPFGFTLSLANTKVTDAGLKEIENLKNLVWLALNDTKVTDAGLKELMELKNLSLLLLDGTKVTDAGVKELQKALPKCAIHR